MDNLDKLKYIEQRVGTASFRGIFRRITYLKKCDVDAIINATYTYLTSGEVALFNSTLLDGVFKSIKLQIDNISFS